MSTTSYLIRFPQSMSVLAALSMVIVTDPLIIASPAATGRTFYVSPGGNDANVGTESSPWQTIAKVCPHSGGRRDGHRHGGDMRLSLKSCSWWH